MVREVSSIAHNVNTQRRGFLEREIGLLPRERRLPMTLLAHNLLRSLTSESPGISCRWTALIQIPLLSSLNQSKGTLIQSSVRIISNKTSLCKQGTGVSLVAKLSVIFLMSPRCRQLDPTPSELCLYLCSSLGNRQALLRPYHR